MSWYSHITHQINFRRFVVDTTNASCAPEHYVAVYEMSEVWRKHVFYSWKLMLHKRDHVLGSCTQEWVYICILSHKQVFYIALSPRMYVYNKVWWSERVMKESISHRAGIIIPKFDD